MKSSEKKLEANRQFHETRTREELATLRRLGVHLTLRTCLRCDKPFPSKGFGNRICPRCKKNTRRHASHVERPVLHGSSFFEDSLD